MVTPGRRSCHPRPVRAVAWVLGCGLAVACSGVERARAPEVVPEIVAPETLAPEIVVPGEPAREEPGTGATASVPASSPEVAPTPAAATPPEPEPEPRAESLELVFVGDVVLGEYLRDRHRSFAGPLAPADPFADVTELLEADLVVGNLESPVMFEIPKRSPIRDGFRFGASEPAVAALAEAGFTVMSVANNHANDLGREGLEQTPDVLRAHGITAVGAAQAEGSPLRVVTLEHRGWRIGLVSATTYLNHAPKPGDPAVPVIAVSKLKRALVPLVEQARADHDLVIVLLHWGQERRERPEPAQIHAAHAFIDAGADLVIGHHPHVLQGIERYGDGLIAYSLGNFLFPAREAAFRDSAVLRVTVDAEGCVTEAGASPIRLERAPGFAPEPATRREHRLILDRLQRLSAGLRSARASTPRAHSDQHQTRGKHRTEPVSVQDVGPMIGLGGLQAKCSPGHYEIERRQDDLDANHRWLERSFLNQPKMGDHGK